MVFPNGYRKGWPSPLSRSGWPKFMSSDAKCPQKSFPQNDLQIDLSKIDPPKEPITTSESHHTSRTSQDFCSKVAHPFPFFLLISGLSYMGVSWHKKSSKSKVRKWKIIHCLSLNSTTFNYISMRVLARSNFEGCLAIWRGPSSDWRNDQKSKCAN